MCSCETARLVERSRTPGRLRGPPRGPPQRRPVTVFFFRISLPGLAGSVAPSTAEQEKGYYGQTFQQAYKSSDEWTNMSKRNNINSRLHYNRKKKESRS